MRLLMGLASAVGYNRRMYSLLAGVVLDDPGVNLARSRFRLLGHHY